MSFLKTPSGTLWQDSFPEKHITTRPQYRPQMSGSPGADSEN